MNFTAVGAVIQVAESGSFVEASRVLGLSTSATSKAVSRLEEELGVKLFQRTTRRVRVTPEGESYVEGIKPLLKQMETVTAEVTGSMMGVQGRLRISVPAAFGRIALLPCLVEFTAQYPDIEFDLILQDRHVDLIDEQVDVVIRAGTLTDSANLIGRTIYKDTLVTCASPSYLKDMGIPDSVQSLEQHRCLNFRNQQTGRAMPWLFKDGQKITVASRWLMDDGEAIARAATLGAGISQMPGFMAQDALRNGMLQEVLAHQRTASVPYTALYLDRRLISARVRAFVDFLSEKF